MVSWDTHDRGLGWPLFPFLFLSLQIFFSLLVASYYTHYGWMRAQDIGTYNGWTWAQDISSPSFFYVHASRHCTVGLIAMSNYYTTLERDQCIVFFFFKVDMSPIVWSIWNYETVVGYMNRIFGSFLKNNVLTTYKVKLWHISCLD